MHTSHSSFALSPTSTHYHHHYPHRTNITHSSLPTHHKPNSFDLRPHEKVIYHHALSQLAIATHPQHYPATPSTATTSFTPSSHSLDQPVPREPLAGRGGIYHDSGIAGVATHDWQQSHMQFQSSMGVPVTQLNQGVKRARNQHQRTPSASSTAPSNGPASPYMQNGSYPHIVNPDLPTSQAFFSPDQAFFSKLSSNAFPDGQLAYTSNQASHLPNAHLAMKGFGINHHNAEDFIPDFAPSRQSMSSYGTDSPATPQSGAGDVDAKPYSIPQNDYTRNPNVQLFRTESQVYQDELYDPNTTYDPAPTKTKSNYLSPNGAHRNLLGERLQTANLARSTSPSSGLSRDRSPFRDGSPLAPALDWKAQGGPVRTAASMRQQQKEQAAQAEFAVSQQRAPLRREPTKTISPKDALLDYHENDQAPLFQDTIPTGYEKHMGGTEQWPSNNYLSQLGASFGSMAANGHPAMTFRNASTEHGYSGPAIDFQNLPPGNDQVQSFPFQANYQSAVAPRMNQLSESTPDFPATIPSMETSHSDAGIPASSQESNTNGYTSAPQRPADTRANTGAYTCTYHGCTQRFDSPGNLQKHKRDHHRSQQPTRDSTSPSADDASSSPRSTESPAPSGSGMTSAALLARNSQAGPHKCTRINPSTNKPCNTIFSRPYDLTRHEDTIHNNRKMKVRCPMCREEKTFSRNDALTRHMRVVHPEVESFGKRARRGD